MTDYKPIVGVDLDGVLADFVGAYLKISRRKYKLPPADYIHSSWDFETLSKLQRDVCWMILKETNNFWETLDRLPNTGDLARRQKEFNLFFITNRVPTDGWAVDQQSMDWLENMYSIKDAYVEVVQGNKGPICKELGIEYFIDDKPSNLEDVRGEVGPAIKLALQDASYNREFECESIKAKRVGSLNEYLEWIKPAKIDARSSTATGSRE